MSVDARANEVLQRHALTDRRRTKPQSSFYQPDWPLMHALARDTRDAIVRYARGEVLDVGAGRAPYRDEILAHSARYVTMDVAPGPGIDVVGSAAQMPFANESFDTLFCSQVLEHVPDVESALAEIARVMRPSAHAIVSVPQYWPEHEKPFDHRRFTIFGLVAYANRYGLEVVHHRRQGGGFAVAGSALNNVLAERLHFGDERYSRRVKLVRAVAIVPLFVLSNAVFALLDCAMPSRDDTLNHLVVLRRSDIASS